VFLDCYSTHIPTQPAHTCMLTGRDPFVTGVIAQGGRVVPPESGVEMLAQTLQRHGYFTAAADNLGRWFTRGFDRYVGYQWSSEPPPRKGESVNASAIPLLRECASRSEPFFLFVHYWDAHTPYLPPPPFSHMFYSGDECDPQNPSMAEPWNFEPFAHYFADLLPGVTDIRFPAASPCDRNHSSVSGSTVTVTRGKRRTARSRISSVSGGQSVVSISSSVIESTQAQSVLEFLFEAFALMVQCLT